MPSNLLAMPEQVEKLLIPGRLDTILEPTDALTAERISFRLGKEEMPEQVGAVLLAFGQVIEVGLPHEWSKSVLPVAFNPDKAVRREFTDPGMGLRHRDLASAFRVDGGVGEATSRRMLIAEYAEMPLQTAYAWPSDPDLTAMNFAPFNLLSTHQLTDERLERVTEATRESGVFGEFVVYVPIHTTDLHQGTLRIELGEQSLIPFNSPVQ